MDEDGVNFLGAGFGGGMGLASLETGELTADLMPVYEGRFAM